MLVLCNKERVLREMMEWARLRLAEVLKVHPGHIKAKWEINFMGGMVPAFSVNTDECDGIEDLLITEVIQSVSRQMKEEMGIRMQGLSEKRNTSNRAEHG